MPKYYNIEEASKLSYEQLVLARCPHWNSDGYQVCRWNGKEFYYDEQPNDFFHKDVIAFMPLNDEGEPIQL